MEDQILAKIMTKLQEDPDFKNAITKYKLADDTSQKYALEIADKLVKDLDLMNEDQTIENARFNLMIAKMSAVKVLAALASFSYEEKDFMDAIEMSRQCVQEEIVPLLMQQEPCGECENCKNGKPNLCIQPKVRETHIESRFLPLLSEALIEYDAWNETLYNNIPADKRDEDVLQDINDEFQNSIIRAKKGKRSNKNKD